MPTRFLPTSLRSCLWHSLAVLWFTGCFPLGAAIEGSVVLNGEVPQPDRVIDLGADPYCSGHGELMTERWKVGQGGALAEVVISLRNASKEFFSERAISALIDQQGCRYAPHVIAIARGTTVTIRNSDQTFHNVRGIRHTLGTLHKGKNLFNFGQPTAGAVSQYQFVESGIYRLECDVHRWMRCWIAVHDNPFFAVSDDEGAFRIASDHLPDGSYQIEAWHPQFPQSLVKEIEVVDGSATVNFAFEAGRAFGAFKK